MANKKSNQSEEGEKRSQAMLMAYRERLTDLKRAQEFSARGDVPKAVESYNTYLNTLAGYHFTTEEELAPKHFDAEKDIAELLLISHAYWDLAKAYDRSPRLRHESVRCLEKFVRFSTGFKFQHINAQMVKKFVKRRRAYNLPAFQEAYNRIYVNSKACFIATHCYPEEEFLLSNLRSLKNDLLKFKLGHKAVEIYYSLSPYLVDFLRSNHYSNLVLTTYFFKPLIRGINYIYFYARIKKTHN
ncbi:MAG: hypothetical protein KDD45_14275 [Bdellovibrionales bacterium]|nr:hypothetical protein [Bdellovibrionales bacterium]